MRQLIAISLILLLSACVSSETTITKKNSGSVKNTEFDPKAAADIRVKLAVGHLQKNNMQKAKENLVEKIDNVGVVLYLV